MKLTRLSLANVRSIESMDIELSSKTTVLVGINGIGKSTVLDSLTILLSHLIPRVACSREKASNFAGDDFRQEGGGWLSATLGFEMNGAAHSVFMKRGQQRHTQNLASKSFRTQTIDTPNIVDITPRVTKPEPNENQPIAVYYGVGRAGVDDRNPSRKVHARHRSSPFAHALESRQLRIQELADWWAVNQELSEGNPSLKLGLENLTRCICEFLAVDQVRVWREPVECTIEDRTEVLPLSAYENADVRSQAIETARQITLRIAEQIKQNSPVSRFDMSAINKHWLVVVEIIAKESTDVWLKTGVEVARRLVQSLTSDAGLPLAMEYEARIAFLRKKAVLEPALLSDGERGVIAVIADLALRLILANPRRDNPIRDGEAVVLIDELDLHLHPKWQRNIISSLERTFPRCQFIVTTHSPQIVAAVEPESVILLSKQGVVRPDRTRGMDTNWILRHLMEDDDRPAEAREAIETVELLVKSGSYAEARKAIADRREAGLDLPEWGVLDARMARMEALAK